MKRKMLNIVAILMIFLGVIFLFFSEIVTIIFEVRSEKVLENLKKEAKDQKQEDLFYKKAYEYNQKIYFQKQKKLKDAWSYEKIPIDFEKNKNIFGYIQIPKMQEKLPLYLGATKENLKKGAAILGQTSLPLGQKNSNCVIAAHRGYQGIPYFREIECLNLGDLVIIKNSWETLKYYVYKIKIIKPYETDNIRIKKGKDMITLLTCHPYRGNGKYRYIVYCIRNDEQKAKRKSDRIIYRSSIKKIEKEKKMRLICILFLIFCGYHRKRR